MHAHHAGARKGHRFTIFSIVKERLLLDLFQEYFAVGAQGGDTSEGRLGAYWAAEVSPEGVADGRTLTMIPWCVFFFAKEMKAHARHHKIRSRSLRSPTAHELSLAFLRPEQVCQIWRWSICALQIDRGRNERVGESSATRHREHARPSSCPRQQS